MFPESTIIIPKTEHPITGDYRADRLIEYVRKNGYPKWDTQPIQFANDKNYALCSELDVNEFDSLMTAVEKGLYDDGRLNEHLERFEGGWIMRNGMTWNVYVDGHLYFFDF